ncbi:toxin-antitoxin system TumE family protein [Candidatus Lokiarchaeum ossiferum]|uniref:toxin-antitoxin system TumE family protein n=1 Tax=Candidatus Lokiarchaeum ossiferum TaxID=2951803 RepID=UPI00352F2E6F
MIDHLAYLQKARTILLEILQNQIVEDEFHESISQLKLVLNSGVRVYIKYNQFGEYGYQILHSYEKNDFSRFDNFDDHWDVKSRPHHHHLKGGLEVIQSPMRGSPENDMPILVKYL